MTTNNTKTKKLWMFKHQTPDTTMVYYVLTNCNPEKYISTALSRYKHHNQRSPIIDILITEHYTYEQLMTEEYDINNLKDAARAMCELDPYSINNQDRLPRSHQLYLLQQAEYKQKKRQQQLALQQANEALLQSGIAGQN